jgi:Ca-activated chloride channel family protein
MTFTRLWALHFLWVIPLLAAALIISARQRRRAMERFADDSLLPRLTGEDSAVRRFLKGIVLLSSLAMMLIALAGPRWGSRYQEVRQKGVDIMIAVDVSASMLVEDVDPSRLERARREIQDLLRVVSGDRVGLIAFSGAAFVQCPLTLDYAALDLFLASLTPDLIPVPGTDLGAALRTAVQSFDMELDTDRVVVLITDGEDNEKLGLEVAKEAAAKGVKAFVFGIGESSGAPVPDTKDKGGFKKDEKGNVVISKLNEQDLRKIASITGGSYVHAVAGDMDLDFLYFDGIKTTTRATTLKSGKVKVYEERFVVFLLAAILLLILEGMITERPRAGRGYPTRYV